MEELFNDNIHNNENDNTSSDDRNSTDIEVVTKSSTDRTVAEAVPENPATKAVPETPADETVPEATVNPAPIDPRYAGYVDNSVTWNGSSYSGRPQQGNTYYTDYSRPAINPDIPQGYPGTQQGYPGAQQSYPGAQQGYQSPSGQTGYSQAYSNYSSYSSGATYTQDPLGAYTPNTEYARHYRFVSEPVMNSSPAKQKKGMPKAVAVILLALLFGVVASGVFIGSNAIFYKLNPNSAPAPIFGGRDTDSTSGGHLGDGNTSSDRNKPGLVSQTDLINDVNTSSTDVSAVVDSAMPSIVSIDCTFMTTSFFGTYETPGAGSGIILKQTADELLIATNNHVVANATSITVTFDDGTSAPAITKGTDSVADLAVVAVSINDLTPGTLDKLKVATIGDSDSIKVGQMVVAIGNAMGYGQSTTVGYVSAKDREVEVDGNTMTLLQTDAAINPGNSGGALLNLNGEVIGINSVKYADNAVEGMGFAIPISRAIAILDELGSREILKDEEKGYLGIYLRDVTSDMAEYYNMPYGVYVVDVTAGCAAEAAGLEIGDVITAVNGHKVLTSTDLKNEVTAHRVGSTITVTYMRIRRGIYEENTVEVTLGKNPELSE